MADPRPLQTEEVAALLASIGDAVRSECGELAEDVAAWHPGEGEWCVKACIGHLIETEERGFAGRIRLVLEEPGRALQGWNQEEVARARNDCDRELKDLVDAFVERRRDSVELVKGLLNVDLTKSGEHPQVGTLRVEDLLHEWVHHDRCHFRQLQAVLQAYAWPSMGNARRFAEVD